MQTRLMTSACLTGATTDEFRLLRGLVYEKSGLWLGEEKKRFVEHKASRRMKALGVPSFYGYYILLNDEEKGGAELLTFLDDLTINETSFFRNKPQFNFFTEVVLPEIISRKRSDGSCRINIWSAGCSTGQEPYTISIILNDAIPDIRSWRVNILASDLSLSALKIAQTGFYLAERMEGLEARHLESCFRRTGHGYTVSGDIRRPVRFIHHNLLNYIIETGFDAVFCRNVLIYFDEKTRNKAIRRFERALVPGGWLFLGHSETLHGIDADFEFFHHNKGTAYRKRQSSGEALG